MLDTPNVDGYMKNGQGHLIPIDLVKPIDRARDELVRELVAAALGLSAHMQDFKKKAFADVNAFVEMSAEQYHAKIGGTKGNITLVTFDGQYKLQVAKADSITFDERLQAAKELIDQCINDWSQGSRPEIRTLVQQAFDTDKEGTINTGRVLALRRLEITDDRWQSAMRAIGESVQITGTKTYIRIYERDDKGGYESIPLDVAAS